jgi:integrase
MSIRQPRTGRVSGHLKLIERKSGPIWYVKTRVPGRTPEQTTTFLAPAHMSGGKPPAGHLTRRQAQDALADILTEERHKVGQRAYDHLGATFADAAAGYLHYIEHVRGRERATLSDYRGSVNNYLVPRWGDMPVDAITSGDVEQMRDELIAAGLSPRTVVRHLTVAHGVFKYAMRRHGLTSNPASADLVDRPTVRYSGEFQALDPEQLAALIRAADTEQDAVLYLTAAQTGLRQGELRALQVLDVDFAADRIHVRRSATVGSNAKIKAPKSGRVRSVPMTPDVAMALARLLQREHFTGPDDLVFPNQVGEVENDTILRRRYCRALDRAGLPRVRFHDLRHVFGSTAVKAFPLSDVQAMLGHAHITTTMRYVHHRPAKDDARRLAAAFEGDSVSPLVSPTGDTKQKLRRTERHKQRGIEPS